MNKIVLLNTTEFSFKMADNYQNHRCPKEKNVKNMGQAWPLFHLFSSFFNTMTNIVQI